MPVIMGAVSAGTGLISGISGLFQKSRAKKLARENVRPTYQIPSEILANKELAQLYANQGMPAEQMAQAEKGIGRSQAASLAASVDKRGGLGTIAGIQGATQNAEANLAAQSAAMRMQNIRGLMSANEQLAQYRDKAFEWNQAQKYRENAQAANALMAAGQQNINQGISGVLGGAADIYMGTKGQSSGNTMKSVANPQIQSAQAQGLNTFMQNRPTIDTSSWNQMQSQPVFSTPIVNPYTSPQANITPDEAAFDIAEGNNGFGMGKMGRFFQNYPQ